MALRKWRLAKGSRARGLSDRVRARLGPAHWPGTTGEGPPPRHDGVVIRQALRYLTTMARVLRIFVLSLIVLGLALAGPVQANCAPPPAAAATPCGEMVMDEAPAHDQRPDAPAKSCAILQCPSALPTFAEVSPEFLSPVVLSFSQTIAASPARAGADSAPEHRPPIF